jgi:Protein of unknown function (DUF1592)/Protein of unknown function (DUF1588)
VTPGETVRLTDHEVASELSFMLTGSIPDDALWGAIESGRFKTADDYLSEGRRLLATPAAREALRTFLHQWLGTNRLTRVRKDPTFYPTFNEAMASSMTGELDRFYDIALASGSLRALFTWNASFADPTLARLYGVSVTGPGFGLLALDPRIRKGVLTRAGFLAAHADTDSSGPVTRGIFVLESILCSPLPPPPANVPPALRASDPQARNLTTRERFEEHLSNAVCASCHKVIDGVGFAFEEFDAIGAYRTIENGQPVDSTGSVAGTGEMDGEYRGVGELATKLSGSQHLVDCYLKQGYRYAMGQSEPHGDDPSSLASLRTGFSADARLTDIFLTLVSSPVFVTRTFE